MGKAKSSKSFVRKSVTIRKKSTEKDKIGSAADVIKDVKDVKDNKIATDIIDYNLDVIFVSVMTRCKKADKRYFYSGSNNQFYKLLHESGFTERKLNPEEDRSLLNYKIGLVNICPNATQKISLAPKEEIQEGVESFIEKIRKYKPRIICFNGKEGYAAFMSITSDMPKNKKYECGFKDDKVIWEDNGFTKIYLLPSTGGLNTSCRFDEKKNSFKELRTLIDG